MGNQIKQQHCSPRSPSSGNSGSVGIIAEILPRKNKTPLVEVKEGEG